MLHDWGDLRQKMARQTNFGVCGFKVMNRPPTLGDEIAHMAEIVY